MVNYYDKRSLLSVEFNFKGEEYGCKKISPFIDATPHVLETMTSTRAKPRKPYLKKDQVAKGDLLIPQPASSEGMSSYELEQEIKVLKEKIEAKGILGGFSDKLTFSGAIELDYSYADDSDIGDNTVNDTTSDLDIGTVELGLEVAFHEYVTGNFILKGEALDTDNDRVFWDEATITIQKEGFPLYFVGGKRGHSPLVSLKATRLMIL